MENNGFKLDNLYVDIGSKIKGLAKWSFIVEAVAAIIAGFVMMVSDEDMILFGLLTMVLGSIVAWVASWLLYGFGELVDKTSEIAKNTAPKEESEADAEG